MLPIKRNFKKLDDPVPPSAPHGTIFSSSSRDNRLSVDVRLHLPGRFACLPVEQAASLPTRVSDKPLTSLERF
jgi:hypothetical protein